MIPLQKKSLKPAQRRLLDLFDRLGEQDRATLTAFAEFLAARGDGQLQSAEESAGPVAPEPIPKPEKESVVGAIKRLSKSYHMLPRQDLLNETSSLMSSHVLQGRPAAEVVEELEVLFLAHYDRYRRQWDD